MYETNVGDVMTFASAIQAIAFNILHQLNIFLSAVTISIHVFCLSLANYAISYLNDRNNHVVQRKTMKYSTTKPDVTRTKRFHQKPQKMKTLQCQRRLPSREIHSYTSDWHFYNLWKFSQNSKVKLQNTNTCTKLLKLLWPITVDDSSDKKGHDGHFKMFKGWRERIFRPAAKLETINPTSYDIVTIYIHKRQWSMTRLCERKWTSRQVPSFGLSVTEAPMVIFHLEFPKTLMGGQFIL